MAELPIAQTLTDKRAEILGRIRAYEGPIAQAKHDLAHVNATFELFAPSERQRACYMVSHGFFKKGEIADTCVRHLDVDGEMTARELAERVMVEHGLDSSDAALRIPVVFKVVQALRHAKRRKLVGKVEKRKGMCAWAAGDAVPASASLPVALPRPADRHGEHPADQTISKAALAFVAMILEPIGVGCIGAQISPLYPQMLAADHAPEPREEAFSQVGMSSVAAIRLGMIDLLQVQVRLEQVPV